MFSLHNKSINTEITFIDGQKKKYFKFKNTCVFTMNRKLRPPRWTQIKKEQINFLLEDVENFFEEYKKAIELKDTQLSDIKKILQGAKKSYDAVVNENTELKKNTWKILNIGTNSTKTTTTRVF